METHTHTIEMKDILRIKDLEVEILKYQKKNKYNRQDQLFS